MAEKEYNPTYTKDIQIFNFGTEQVPWINAPQINQNISIET